MSDDAEDDWIRIAAQNAADANTRLAAMTDQRDELLAVLNALADDYTAICGDGMIEGTEPEVLKRARAAIAKASGPA